MKIERWIQYLGIFIVLLFIKKNMFNNVIKKHFMTTLSSSKCHVSRSQRLI